MSVLKIHMTYQCTARCDHCRFGCSSAISETIDQTLALDCVKLLKEHNNLELVVLMGGEPGLFPETTHYLASQIRKLDIAVRIETNAFWATSIVAASKFLEPLYSINASVMFSLDSFHEPFVSPNHVEYAIKASDRLKGRYNIESAYMDHPNSHHERDLRTDELLRDMEDRIGRSPCCRVYKGGVFYNGRASVVLADQVSEERGVPDDVCQRVPWWTDGWLNTLDLLILDAEGYISKGCGIAIGNVKRTPLEEVIKSFDASKHPIFSILMEHGPVGLAKQAVDLGYSMKADYADKCHLCQEARNILRIRYPGYLAPSQHYNVVS
jgi:organic radical activating enzyme